MGDTGVRRDFTKLADLAHEPVRGGPVRRERPLYVDLLPPCNAGCPAGEDIQGWLALAVDGNDEGAWRHLTRDNPFPSICGRVCYHPCETVCNRGELDEPIAIHLVERYLGDRAAESGWEPPHPAAPSGRRVLVIGAGPCGLAAAYHLARLGHRVEVRDASAEPGGMMRYGIPAYRLPRDVLAGEIDRIRALGVTLVPNHRVVDLVAEQRDGGFDAVFVAVGAGVGKHIDIPARDAGRIVDAVSYLHDVAEGEKPFLGRRVAIYGGGNTAMDAARTAKRLGASDAMIIYRRTRAQMPAHEEEAAEAEREGVTINWLRTVSAIEGDTIRVEVMELDDAGRPHPTGRFEDLSADALVLAVGQDADTHFLRGIDGVEFAPDGSVLISDSMMTGRPGLFAGGDAVPAERTVTVSLGHGKRAARHIDAWLRGATVDAAPKHPTADFDLLQPWYFSDAQRREAPERAADERTGDFGEIVGALTTRQARYEAARCLSCGNCFECDGCLAACPVDAIRKVGPGEGYEIDFDVCTGCRACVEQCPVHALEMVPEPAAPGGTR